LSPFYLDLISLYLILFPFYNYFTSIANYYISETNILKIKSWSKRKGFGADSGWKYEDSVQKYDVPDVAYLRISKVSIYISSPRGLVRYHGLFDIDYYFKL